MAGSFEVDSIQGVNCGDYFIDYAVVDDLNLYVLSCSCNVVSVWLNAVSVFVFE